MCGWKSEQLYPFLLVGSYGRMVGKRYDSDASAVLETQRDNRRNYVITISLCQNNIQTNP